MIQAVTFKVICNECKKELVVDDANWYIAKSRAEDQGWKFYPSNEYKFEWQNDFCHCPQCYRKLFKKYNGKKAYDLVFGDKEQRKI